MENSTEEAVVVAAVETVEALEPETSLVNGAGSVGDMKEILLSDDASSNPKEIDNGIFLNNNESSETKEKPSYLTSPKPTESSIADDIRQTTTSTATESQQSISPMDNDNTTVKQPTIAQPALYPPSTPSTTNSAAAQINSIRNSEAFTAFRKNVMLVRFPVKNVYWSLFEIDTSSPASSTATPTSEESILQDTPIICLPGTTGTADVFFYQLLSIGSKGYRIISVTYPPVFSVNEFSEAFLALLDALRLRPTQKVHLLGASLGGYLALQFATRFPNRVESIMLINSFIDTSEFQKTSYYLKMLKYSPEFVLKKMVLDSFPTQSYYPEAIDFMVDSFETLKRDDIAARLTVNSLVENVNTNKLSELPITIMDSQDDVTMPASMRQRLYDALPNAKHAFLKNGGDFPFLTVPDEINMLIQVHLRSVGHFPAPPLPHRTETPASSSSTSTSAVATAEQSASSPSSSIPKKPPQPAPSQPNFLSFKPTSNRNAAKFYEGSLEDLAEEKKVLAPNTQLSESISKPIVSASSETEEIPNKPQIDAGFEKSYREQQLHHQHQRELIKSEIRDELLQDNFRPQNHSSKLAALLGDEESSSKPTSGGIFD